MKTSDNTSRECSCGCGAAGTIFGIILGVIVAVLFSLGLTPLIMNGIWVAFSIGGAALLYILFTSVFASCSDSCCHLEKCLIKNSKCLITGTLGTLLTTIALVCISLETSSILVAILVAVATFFVVFLLASLISFVKCLIFRR